MSCEQTAVQKSRKVTKNADWGEKVQELPYIPIRLDPLYNIIGTLFHDLESATGPTCKMSQ